jgi:hypothetical protein
MLSRSTLIVIAGIATLNGISVACGSSLSGPTPATALSLLAVVPNTGPTGGVMDIRIEGTGFVQGAMVSFGDGAAAVTSVNWSAITVNVPAHPVGVVDVLVSNPGGQSTTLPAAFTYTPLVITEITRRRGLAGAQNAIVEGTGFARGLKLAMDGIEVPIQGATATAITVTLPFHEPGTFEVLTTVTNRNGESTSITRAFTFEMVTLTPSTVRVNSGERLSVSWTAPDGRTGGDWITFSRVGDSTGREVWFPHTGGEASGTFSLTAPHEPGQYEFRYLIDNVVFARSSPITVSAFASP